MSENILVLPSGIVVSLDILLTGYITLTTIHYICRLERMSLELRTIVPTRVLKYETLTKN